jgi:cyclase
MKVTLKLVAVVCFYFATADVVRGQDFDPQIHKIKDGIYVYVGKNLNSNAGIILTQEGVVLIDSGHNPTDSRAIAAAVKKLTPLPVRFLIDTEPHPDHTTGHFVHSPPAVIVAHEGATESMKGRERDNPGRIQKLAAVSPEIGVALQGYQFVPPHIEYQKKMTLNVGERTFELMYLHGVHSEADNAVWLPKERVIFTAASVGVKRFGNHRPLVSIPDTLSGIKMMRALNPEVVIPGHGDPGGAKMLEDMEGYYSLLMEGVRAMVKAGKSLDDIKKELKIPGTEDWAGKDRYPNNIEAAYRGVTGK